jgi:uncharacterized protein YggU (UPF0235/DUF167 family)
VSVLEWLLILEAVLLLTAGIFWLTGFAIGRDNPQDPFTAFYLTFWKVFLRKRGRLRSAVTSLDVEKARQYEELKQTGDVEGIKELLSDEFGAHSFDESEISAALDESGAPAPDVGADDAGAEGGGGVKPRAAVMNVKVIPFANTNELVSLRSDGATVQVTCGPEEGQANKVVLDAVAAALQVKPYQVTLLKGHYKPFKVVQIAGFDQHQLDVKLAGYS